MSDIQSLLNDIKVAVYGRDVRKSIHDAIEKCYHDGKAGSIDLEARRILEIKADKEALALETSERKTENATERARVDALNLETRQILETKADKEALALETSERKTEIAVERARIDNFTTMTEGSTTGDAELQDIRVKVDGNTASSAGNAVREQINALDDKIDEKTSQLSGEIANITQYATDAIYESGKYIDAETVIRNSDGNTLGTVKVFKGCKVLYSGTAYFSNVCGYYADGTVVKLFNENTTVIDKIIEITDEKIVEVKAWSNHDRQLILKVYGLAYSVEDIYNHIKNIEKHLNLIEPPQQYGYVNTTGTLIKDTSDYNKYIEYSDVKVGDTFIFSGYYASTFNLVWGYYADGTAIPLLSYGLYNNKIIEITDSNIVKVIGWSDVRFKELVFNYYVGNENNSLYEVIVDANGNGDFTDIDMACDYAKNNYDVKNIPITIFIKNGVYNVPLRSDRAMAINKGYNRISIKGESRDGVILNLINRADCQNKVLDIGGECTIENLTINCLNDGTLTATNHNGNNPYCIHNDSGEGEKVVKYYTTVKNCKLYSECSFPLGAGLHDKQTQRYENCEFINNAVLTGQGAIYIHASWESFAVDMGVEIDNCVAISKNGDLAIMLNNTSGYGALEYTDIDTTIRRTIAVTNGDVVTNVSKATHKMTVDCALNNVEALNY